MAAISVKAALQAAESSRRRNTMAAIGPLGLLVFGGVVAAVGAFYGQPLVQGFGTAMELMSWLVASTALMRVALADDHPADTAFQPGPLGFQFSAQEWRFFGAAVLTILAAAACFVFPVLMGAAIGILVNGSSRNGGEAAITVVKIAAVIGLVAAAYMGVRLSLARAASLASKRIEMGWGLTAGRFWPLFGAFVSLFLMFAAVVMLVGVPLGMIAALSGDPAAIRPRVAAVDVLVTAVVIAFLQIPLQVGLEASLYRMLKRAAVPAD